MTPVQLTVLCRSIERQDIVEVAMISGATVYGIPERVRIDVKDDCVDGEVVLRPARGLPEAIPLAEIAALRYVPCLGKC